MNNKKLNKIKQNYDNKIIEIEPNSFLKYNILGRIYTKYESYRLKIKNKKTTHSNGYNSLWQRVKTRLNL